MSATECGLCGEKYPDGNHDCEADNRELTRLRAENATLKKNLRDAQGDIAEEVKANAKLRAVADAAASVAKEYPEIARRHGLGQALAALNATHCGCMDLGNGVTTNPCARCAAKKRGT